MSPEHGPQGFLRVRKAAGETAAQLGSVMLEHQCTGGRDEDEVGMGTSLGPEYRVS